MVRFRFFVEDEYGDEFFRKLINRLKEEGLISGDIVIDAKKLPLPPLQLFSLLPIPSLCSAAITASGAENSPARIFSARYFWVEGSVSNE